MSKSAGEYLSSGPRFGEGEVIERIESFRRRRPRLLDDHVTLAHGAGGKASAALVDAVFMEAFRNPLLESLGDGAVLTLAGRRAAGDVHGLIRGAAQAFSRRLLGELAVHGTCNDLAMAGAVPSWIAAAFVLEEGFSDRRVEGDRRRHVAPRPQPRVCRSSPVTPRWCPKARPTACSSPPPGPVSSPRGASSRRSRCAPVTRCSCRGRWAITAWPSCSPGATWPSRPTFTPTPPRSARWWNC